MSSAVPHKTHWYRPSVRRTASFRRRRWDVFTTRVPAERGFEARPRRARQIAAATFDLLLFAAPKPRTARYAKARRVARRVALARIQGPYRHVDSEHDPT